jgi:MFS family permease
MTTIQGDARASWRTPVVVLVCGCLISLLTFGPRASLGLFTVPYTVDRGFSLETFSFAMAVQNLIWGMGQPFAGGLADRFGTVKVLVTGLVLYAIGLALMAIATDPWTLNLGAGVLIGLGLSGAAFNLVLAAFSKLIPEKQRGLAFGLGSAAGSFGQFLFAPLSILLIREIGWMPTLLVFAVICLFAIPLAFAVATAPNTGTKATGDGQTAKAALAQAFGHRSYVLLVAGFFVCGFHLAFITIHLPKYLVEKGLAPEIGAWTLAAIGLANIAGSLGSGMLMQRMPKRWLLAAIYGLRALAIVVFVLTPVSPVTAILFGVAMGFLWLSTIPPTNALVIIMFGTRWVGLLYGIAFFSHQVGSFVGLVIAGWTRAWTGTYDIIWWLGILLGVAAAIVNLPIVEKAAPRVGEPARA